MRKITKIILAASMLPLAACSSIGEGTDLGAYSLVRVKETKVGNGSMAVLKVEGVEKLLGALGVELANTFHHGFARATIARHRIRLNFRGYAGQAIDTALVPL